MSLPSMVLTLAQLSDATLMSWDEAHARAKPLVAQMTSQEKYGLMLGTPYLRQYCICKPHPC